MFKIYLCVATEHDWLLLLVAGLVCLVSTLATFFLYSRVPSGPFWRRWTWLSMTALVAGSGIWTTHFVAMLAFRTGLVVGYRALETFGSLAIAIACAGVGFAVGSLPVESKHRLWATSAGGLIVGLGITLMHYVGMLGYQTEGFLQWTSSHVIASTLIGAVMATAALAVAARGAGRWRRALAAGLLSLGIVGMHITGMAAVTIVPDPDALVSRLTMSNTVMASIAIGVTAVILITALAGVLFDTKSRQGNLKRLSEALDVMQEGVGFYDAEERLVVWNAGFAEKLTKIGPLVEGSTYEAMMRRLIAANLYQSESGCHEALLAERLAEFRSGSGTREVHTRDGRWIRVTHRRTQGGCTVTTTVDITLLKQAEADMARARDAAEAANRAKSEFLANMSHEIRTPMNGIMGMNSLMLLSPLNGDQRLYAETVQSSAETLMRILNDILDMSKLEAGKVRLEMVEFSFQELTRDAVRSVASSAEDKGLALSCDAPGGWFVGDPGRIRQVLLNLVTNAVKFTDQGSIDIRVHARPSARQTHFRVEVADTGIGLTDDAKARLFQPFEQADGSITRRFGGSGLGLSICRQLVQLMDGRIGVDDRPGGGSIFWFEMDLEPVEEAAPALLRQTG